MYAEALVPGCPSISLITSLTLCYKALHKKENKSKGFTGMQFFLIAMGVSFLYYYALPGYLFTILTFFSWMISQGNKVGTFTLD